MIRRPFCESLKLSEDADIAAALEDLKQRASLLSVHLDEKTLQLIGEFCRQLAAYNQHTNLVSKADAPNLVQQHIADSLSLVGPIADRQKMNHRLVDIGSGAGFPAIILALTLADLQVVFIESISKKAKFLQQVCGYLGLDNRVKVLAERAETCARQKDLRDSFGFATARAVGSLSLISELTLPFLQTGGCLLAQKSQKQADDEIREAASLVTALGGSIREKVIPNPMAVGKDVVIIEVVKTQPTPPKYPRQTAQLGKGR